MIAAENARLPEDLNHLMQDPDELQIALFGSTARGGLQN